MKSFLITAVSALVAGTLLSVPTAFAGKSAPHVKHTVKLKSSEPLVLSLEGDLGQCVKWDCWVKLRAAGAKELAHRLVLKADGSWLAYGPEEEDKDKKKDKKKDKDKDADEESEEWRSKPVLSKEERIEKRQLALENTLREAKGEEPLAKLEKEDETTPHVEDKKIKHEDDAYLSESGRILLDYLGLHKAMAKNQSVER